MEFELTEREQYIIDKAAEKALLKLPEVVGNLMTQHTSLLQMNRDFYKDHPEFSEHKDIVAYAVEKVDGENPTLEYSQKLAKAVPEIERRIKLLKTMDMKSVSDMPKRDYRDFDVPAPSGKTNGVI